MLLVESGSVDGPALFGPLAPKVLLPMGIGDRLSEMELRHVILHELCHVRRRDILMNWTMTLLGLLHWFNPLVWLALNRMRSDREVACDARVLGVLGGDQTRSYGMTIVKLLEEAGRTTPLPGTIGILEERGQMVRRIGMIAAYRGESLRMRLAGVALCLLFSGVALTDARSPQSTSSPLGQEKLRIRVEDGESGRPVQGAMVRAGSDSVQTNADGVCETGALPPFWIQVRRAGYAPAAELYDPDAPGAERVIRLERGRTIGGIVGDENGNPIEGAVLSIEFALPYLSDGSGRRMSMGTTIRSAPDGTWRCSEIPRRISSLSIDLDHPEHASAFYSVGTPSVRALATGRARTVLWEALPAFTAVLVMPPGLEVAGTVMDSRGTPIAGAEVIQHLSASTGPPLSTTTSEQGEFKFGNCSPGTIRLTIQAPGYSPLVRAVDVTSGLPPVEVYLQRGGVLRGRVVDQAGDPIAGAAVSAERGSYLSWRARSDEEGRFSWDSAPKSAVLRFDAPGYKSVSLELDAGGREQLVRLTGSRSPIVSGRVLDADTNQPIPQFTVAVSRYSPSGTGWSDHSIVARGQHGSFRFQLSESRTRPVVTPEGTRSKASLRIDAPGYLPDVSHEVVLEDGDTHIEIRLMRGECPKGAVILASGRPVAGAVITILRGDTVTMMDFADYFGRKTGNRPGMQVESSDDGTFAVDPLQSAKALVAVQEQGGVGFSTMDEFRASGRITLEPWGRVEGRLQVGRNPGADEIVSLEPLIREGVLSLISFRNMAITDNEGRFSFERVPPGEYRLIRVLRLSTLGGEQRSTLDPVVVRPGTTAEVRVGGTGRAVIGSVELAAWRDPFHWNDLPQMLVTKLPALPNLNSAELEEFWRSAQGKERVRARRQYAVEFVADGSFRIEDVPPGDYLLRLQLPNLTMVTREVRVEMSSPGPIDEPLNLGTVTIRN